MSARAFADDMVANLTIVAYNITPDNSCINLCINLIHTKYTVDYGIVCGVVIVIKKQVIVSIVNNMSQYLWIENYSICNNKKYVVHLPIINYLVYHHTNLQGTYCN